jgi:hypothetical protein
MDVGTHIVALAQSNVAYNTRLIYRPEQINRYGATALRAILRLLQSEIEIHELLEAIFTCVSFNSAQMERLSYYIQFKFCFSSISANPNVTGTLKNVHR